MPGRIRLSNVLRWAARGWLIGAVAGVIGSAVWVGPMLLDTWVTPESDFVEYGRSGASVFLLLSAAIGAGMSSILGLLAGGVFGLFVDPHSSPSSVLPFRLAAPLYFFLVYVVATRRLDAEYPALLYATAAAGTALVAAWRWKAPASPIVATVDAPDDAGSSGEVSQ